MLGSLKFNAPKCETNSRLCLGRIRLLKNKKNMQMRGYRKDIADLLKAGKLDYAIIRVESVIREQLTLTAYEILELYLELVAVRSAMIAQSKTIPGDMMEALSSVLYASSRCPELEELVKLRAMFEQKYGKEYVGAALSDRDCHRFSVNERLIRCLTVEPPPPDLKLQTLSEIAQEYAIEWDAAEARRVLLGDMGSIAYAPISSSTATRHTPSAAAAAGGGGGGPITGLVLRPSDETLDILGPSLAQQQQQQQGGGSSGGYADVVAAAQAAARAAQQAQAAADAAAKMAAGVGAGRGAPGGLGVPPGGGGGGGGSAVPSAIRPPGPPQQGWLADMENFQHIQPPSPGIAPLAPPPPPPAAAAAAGGLSAGGPPAAAPVSVTPPAAAAGSSQGAGSSSAAAAAAAGGSSSAGVGGFKVPSAEEIQRAYDQAQGPPPKPHLAGGPDGDGAGGASAGASGLSGRPQGPMAPPPAAPPVKATDDDIAAAAAAAAGGGAGGATASSGDGSSGLLDLPSVPGGGSSGGGASAPVSDFDELQRRFEALKKS